MSNKLVASVAFVGIFLAVSAAQLSAQAQGPVLSLPSESDLVASGGGNVKGFRAKTENSPTTTTSTAFAQLPGAGLNYTVPAGKTDTFLISFTAECALFNATSPIQDWVEVQIRLDGVPVDPTQTGASPVALCSQDAYSSNAISAVAPGVGPGAHVVRLVWRVKNNSGAAGLTAWVDDWNLQMLINEP